MFIASAVVRQSLYLKRRGCSLGYHAFFRDRVDDAFGLFSATNPLGLSGRMDDLFFPLLFSQRLLKVNYSFH